MPESLHSDLAEAAEREGSSLNQFITGVLASAVGWRGDGDPQQPGGAPRTTGERHSARSPWTTRLLVANFVVVTVVAIAAIAFLIAAVR